MHVSSNELCSGDGGGGYFGIADAVHRVHGAVFVLGWCMTVERRGVLVHPY